MGGEPTVRGVAHLEHQHRWLEDMFLRHQEALLVQAPHRARRLLRRYRRLLKAHTRREEWLFEAVVGASTATRWPVGTYRAEHRRLIELVDALCAEIEYLPDAPIPAPRLIELIERGSRIKRVAEHHQTREEQDLYPQARQMLRHASNSRRGPIMR